MSKVTVELDWDAIEKVVIESLKQDYKNFQDNSLGIPFVSHDETEESKYVKKMLKSYKAVLKYYGVDVESI